jgi:hypothetical protein
MRDEARQDVFDYIEMFCNPKRRHGFNERLSPVNYEKRYFERLASVQQTRGDSVSGDITKRYIFHRQLAAIVA